MQYGEQHINGYWYYFATNNGDMAKGFTHLADGRTVYYDQNGRMLYGKQLINGKWYNFRKDNGDLIKQIKCYCRNYGPKETKFLFFIFFCVIVDIMA